MLPRPALHSFGELSPVLRPVRIAKEFEPLRGPPSTFAACPGALREQLGDLLETIPSGHDLPAFRAATGLLNDSG